MIPPRRCPPGSRLPLRERANMTPRTRRLAAIGLLLTLTVIPAAHGQYPPGYWGGGGYYPGVVGGALQGSADVINAYGNLGQQNEQARIMREQANQAKLDTKKQS